jgi:cbb3-type cytochrome oxidase subunit 1
MLDDSSYHCAANFWFMMMIAGVLGFMIGTLFAERLHIVLTTARAVCFGRHRHRHAN